MPLQRNKISLSIALALSLTHEPVFAQFDPLVELSGLNGQNGLTFNGVSAGDKTGVSVSQAGDINGDGISDLIIGAYDADANGNTSTGRSYVVFGSSNPLPNPFDLNTLNGINGFTINGVASNDKSGISVSSAGDVNGDGIDDLIVGSDGAETSYVVFGSDTGLPNPLNLSSLNGVNGFSIVGVNSSDKAGRAVSYAGDVNGDGIADMIIGAYRADPNNNSTAGSSYVVFGADTGLPNPLNLSSLDGSNGFVINGVAENDQSGFSVSAAGDVNDDGFDDVIVGAKGADPNGNSLAGSSYVVFGTDDPLPNPVELNSLNGLNGFIINGVAATDQAGIAVGAAGDINGDGIDDLIIGAYGANPNNETYAGSSYVIYGVDGQLPNPFNLSNINGLNGIVLNGATSYDLSGRAVSAAGDINGDGIDDIIIGSPGAFNSDVSSHVVFGSNNQLPNPFDLTSLDGTNGFTIIEANPNDNSGFSISGAGDINDDGIDDLIIGATNASPNGNTNAGSGYVVFGISDVIFKDGFE